MPNIAVVGVGYWGPNLVRNLVAIENVRLTTVCDIEETRLQPIKRQYPTVELTTDLAEVLRNPSIDAVVVALPVALHFQVAREVLNSGKHTLIEKPLCMTTKEAIELI